MTYFIHVNGQRIKANKRFGKNDPPVRFQKGKYGTATYCYRLRFKDAEIIYDAHGDTFTKCGARLVIKTEVEPVVLE